jgi:hypothetical protein
MPLLESEREIGLPDDAGARSTNILDVYVPPFDLTAEMLFAGVLCPTHWLKQSFPDVPFLSLWGRTPLALWFSRINQIVYNLPDGGTNVLGAPDATLYNELNIMALLRRPAFFVPGIYATTDLTIRIGRTYGMPKQMTKMTYERQGKRITSENWHGGRRSEVQATVWGSGKALGTIARWLLPLRIWEARFPEGQPLRPLLEDIPRLAPARIQRGEIWVNEPWMPQPLPLLPFGFHAPALRMKLPPPRREYKP